MDNRLGSAAGQLVKRVAEAAAGMVGAIARRYRGARDDLSAVSAGGNRVDAEGRAEMERSSRDVRAFAAERRAEPPRASSRVMSEQEFWQRFLAAERSGAPEIRTPAWMTGQSGIVDLHVYPDGFELIEKLDTPRHRSAEILASAIGGAIGAPSLP